MDSTNGEKKMRKVVYFIPVVAITGAIIVAGMIMSRYLDTSANRLLKEVMAVQTALEDEDWQQSLDGIVTLREHWRRVETMWTIILDHAEIDNIWLSVARVEAAVNARDKEAAEQELGALKVLIEHIPEKESPSFENIL
jgi:hypothetical protein